MEKEELEIFFSALEILSHEEKETDIRVFYSKPDNMVFGITCNHSSDYPVSLPERVMKVSEFKKFIDKGKYCNHIEKAHFLNFKLETIIPKMLKPVSEIQKHRHVKSIDSIVHEKLLRKGITEIPQSDLKDKLSFFARDLELTDEVSTGEYIAENLHDQYCDSIKNLLARERLDLSGMKEAKEIEIVFVDKLVESSEKAKGWCLIRNNIITSRRRRSVEDEALISFIREVFYRKNDYILVPASIAELTSRNADFKPVHFESKPSEDDLEMIFTLHKDGMTMKTACEVAIKI